MASGRFASLVAAVAVAVAVVVAGCSSDGSLSSPNMSDSGETTQREPTPPDDEPAVETEATEIPEVPTTDGANDDTPAIDVVIDPGAHISLAASVTVTTDEAMYVQVSASGPDHVVDVPRTAEMATEHVIPLVGMRAESTYAIDVSLSDDGDETIVVSDAGEFTTGSLPAYFADHELTIDADRAAPGYTIVEFDSFQAAEGAPSSQHLVAYDDDGEIVWYYTNTGALGGVEPTPAGTFDMFYWPFGIREVDVLGNVVGNWRPQPQGVESGGVDDDFVVDSPDRDQVEFQGGDGALVGNPGDVEPVPIVNDWIDLTTVHHENWPMPNGNILTLSTTTHELTPDQRSTFCPDDPNEFDATSDVAVEFTPDGRVVRTWDL